MAFNVKSVLGWIARNSIRLVVALVLLLTLIGVSLWFAPFSSEFVNNKVRESFARSTGLELRFEALVFYLAQERIILRDATIVDPQNNEVLAGAERLEAQLDVAWRQKEIAAVRSLLVNHPAPLVFIRTRQGIKPAPNLERLLESRRDDSATTATTRAGDGPSLAINTVTLDDVAIQLIDAATNQPLAQVEQADVLGSWAGSEDFDMQATGRLKALTADRFSDWQGKISRSPARDGIHFFTRFQEITGESQVKIDLPLTLTGSDVRLGGDLIPASEGQSLFRGDIQLSAANLLLHNRLSNQTLRAAQLHLNTKGSFDTDTFRLDLDGLDAQALGLEAQGDLTVDLEKPYEYQAVVRRLSLPQDAIQRLQAFLPDLRKVIDYRGGDLLLEGLASGSLLEGMPRTLEGNLNLKGVEVAVAALPLPLSRLNGSLSFDGDVLQAHEISGVFGESFVRLGGELTSEEPQGLLNRKPSALRMAWFVDGTSDDMLALLTHTETKAIEGLKSSGAVETSGTLSTEFGDPPNLETAAKSLQVRGTAQLREFSLDHPKMPAPVRNVRGRMDVRNGEILLKNLRGELLGSSASFSGSVAGDPYFWKNPKANLQIQTTLDLARVSDEVRPRVEDQFDLPPLSGQASGAIAVKGDLGKPSSLTYTGDIDLKDVETEVHAPGFDGRLSNVSGKVQLDNDRMSLENVSFRIGDVRYGGDVSVSRAELKAQVSASGPLEQMKKNHHPLMKAYDVGGMVELEDSVHLVLPGAHRQKALADDRFPPLLPFIDGVKAVRAEAPDTINAIGRLVRSQDGRWTFKNAKFSHLSFPAPMDQMNGTLQLVDDGFRSGPVPMRIGGYPATVAMRFVFIEDGHRAMNFDINANRMDLTPWYGKWRKLPPEARGKPAPTNIKPRLKSRMQISIHTGPAKIRQYSVNKHDADLTYENWYAGNKLLFLRQIVSEGYSGIVRTEGKMTFVRNGPVLWETFNQSQGIDLVPFVKDGFNNESFMGGRMDLTLSLKGQNLDKKLMEGSGEINVDDPNFRRGNPVVVEFVQLVRVFQLDEMVFPEAKGKFVVDDGFVQSDRATMGNNVIDIAARGRVGLDLYLDFEVFVRPLSGVQKIPLLGRPVGEVVDRVSSSLLRFRIKGPANNASVNPLPVVTDRIDDLMDLFSW